MWNEPHSMWNPCGIHVDWPPFHVESMWTGLHSMWNPCEMNSIPCRIHGDWTPFYVEWIQSMWSPYRMWGGSKVLRNGHKTSRGLKPVVHTLLFWSKGLLIFWMRHTRIIHLFPNSMFSSPWLAMHSSRILDRTFMTTMEPMFEVCASNIWILLNFLV